MSKSPVLSQAQIDEGYRLYDTARRYDRKHPEALRCAHLPSWTHQAWKIKKRQYARNRRGFSANPRIDSINQVPQCIRQSKGWPAALSWAKTVRANHPEYTYKNPPTGWVLRDDDIIDDIAIEIAITGRRSVRLTKAERRVALMKLIQMGVTSSEDIAGRLRMGPSEVRKYMTEIEALAA